MRTCIYLCMCLSMYVICFERCLVEVECGRSIQTRLNLLSKCLILMSFCGGMWPVRGANHLSKQGHTQQVSFLCLFAVECGRNMPTAAQIIGQREGSHNKSHIVCTWCARADHAAGVGMRGHEAYECPKRCVFGLRFCFLFCLH